VVLVEGRLDRAGTPGGALVRPRRPHQRHPRHGRMLPAPVGPYQQALLPVVPVDPLGIRREALPAQEQVEPQVAEARSLGRQGPVRERASPTRRHARRPLRPKAAWRWVTTCRR
jgi:hypothetical protein